MSWFQNIIVMPIVIGYLAQLLIEPDGGLGTFSQLKKMRTINFFEIESYYLRFNSELVDIKDQQFEYRLLPSQKN